MDQLKDILGQGFGEKVLDYLKELSKGLGVAVEHVYEVMVRQQIAWGIAAMAGWGIAVLVLLIILSKVPKWYKSSQDYEVEKCGRKDGDVTFGFTMLAIVLLAGIGGSLTGVFYGFMHVFNPEYYAIQEIITAITGTVKNK